MPCRSFKRHSWLWLGAGVMAGWVVCKPLIGDQAKARCLVEVCLLEASSHSKLSQVYLGLLLTVP